MASLRLYTLRDCLSTIADTWRTQYGTGPYKWTVPSNAQAVYNRLSLLDGLTCTRDEVDQAIGNDSWTNLRCDLCRAEKLDAVLRYTSSHPDEEPQVDFCLKCFGEAAKTAGITGDW
jgi:hypothetical protein